MTRTSLDQQIKSVAQEIDRCLGTVDVSSVDRAIAQVSAAERVFLAGAGRSALAIRAHAMRLMHMGKTAYVVGDVTTPNIKPDDLLIVGSGSGRTASLLASAQKAKDLGARLLLLTIDPQSPIGLLADDVVKIAAPSPKAAQTPGAVTSIQPMGALFEQCLFILLDLMILALMQRQGLSAEQMFARHANLE